MKTLSECYYFQKLEDTSPVVFKSLKEKLKKIAKAIYSDNFKKNKYFDFTLSKKVKETL